MNPVIHPLHESWGGWKRGIGKGELRPAPKSGSIAGLHCCCLLPSPVYGSVLVTLETAVGAL